MFASNTIVAFHITRGGMYHTPGHIVFLGAHKIGEYTADLFAPILEDGEEDNSPEAELMDENGNGTGCTNAMIASGIGRIDIDGQYDTTYTMRLGDIDIDSKEYNAIFREDADIRDAEPARKFFE